MLTGVLRDAADAGYQVTISGEASAALEALCVADLSNGGRGIRNKIETHLVNPLARALFEQDGPGPYFIRDNRRGL